MKKTFTVGLIILILGVALVIVSQTVSFISVQDWKIWGLSGQEEVENKALKNAILYGGIAALIIGGIIFSISLGNLLKTK